MKTSRQFLVATSAFAAAFAIAAGPGPDGTLQLGGSAAFAQGAGGGNGGGGAGGGNGGGGGHGGGGAAGGGGHGGGAGGGSGVGGGPEGAGAAAAGGGFGRGGASAGGFGRGGDVSAGGFGRGGLSAGLGDDDDAEDDATEFGAVNAQRGRSFGMETAAGAYDASAFGAVASELKGYNAAHAADEALTNAAPASMVGQVRDYRDSTPEVQATTEQDLGLSDEAVAQLRGLLGLPTD